LSWAFFFQMPTPCFTTISGRHFSTLSWKVEIVLTTKAHQKMNKNRCLKKTPRIWLKALPINSITLLSPDSRDCGLIRMPINNHTKQKTHALKKVSSGYRWVDTRKETKSRLVALRKSFGAYRFRAYTTPELRRNTLFQKMATQYFLPSKMGTINVFQWDKSSLMGTAQNLGRIIPNKIPDHLKSNHRKPSPYYRFTVQTTH